jgi:hypothetical protein
MAHFAKLDENNVVTQVIVVANESAPDEKTGQEFLASIGFEGTWIQTSYNTRSGIHDLGGTPLRWNYAGIGYSYDPARDAFIPPKPEDTETIVWKLDQDTLLWQSFQKTPE